jgi:N-acetylmuramoyl-L-alanine amidase
MVFGCSSTVPMQLPMRTGIVSGPLGAMNLYVRQDLYHEVAPMETLWRISKMYDVDQDVIAKVNHLSDPTSIGVGQKLLIPDAKPLRQVIPLYDSRDWTHIVIHHTATDRGNALTINESHHQRGFGNGLGYHFLIDNGTVGKESGQIEVGPRWVKQMAGAHANANGMNAHGIGIALVGNFSETEVSEHQFDSLVFLVDTLRKHYQIPIDNIIGHREVPGKNTECPGTRFPWSRFKKALKDIS